MKMVRDDKTSKIRERSKTLSGLGGDIAKMKFSYEVKNKTEQKYWQRRIERLTAYFEKSEEYYNQAYQLMRVISSEQADMFLLAVSKFHQLKTKQLKTLEKIMKNPTVMKSKDRQQSTWSKDAREEIIENSNRCLEHEKIMSMLFREFFDRYQKDVSGD